MACPLCNSGAHQPRAHDFNAFLRRLPTADREKLLRAASTMKANDAPAPSGRWIASGPGGLRVADPQSAIHSEPVETTRQDA